MSWIPQPPTAKTSSEYIVQLFAAVVSAMIILTMLAVVVIEVISPETNTDTVIKAQSETVSVMLGALIGYLAGRGQSAVDREQKQTKEEANE